MRRQEHYAANAAVKRLMFIFEVMADEYNEEAELQHREEIQDCTSVLRPERTVQLTCQIGEELWISER